MISTAGNRERKGQDMREGKRVFGASCNPITGLVKRHADHKNSKEVTWGLSWIYRACPVGRRG